MRYRKTYQLTHDIDWFCIVNNIPVHVASNCCPIPLGIDGTNNRRFQQDVSNIERENAISLSIKLQNLLFNGWQEIFQSEDELYNSYTESFVAMAKKGFVSFDCQYVENNIHYIIVAYPNNPLVLREINPNIYESLPILSMNDLPEIFDILAQL